MTNPDAVTFLYEAFSSFYSYTVLSYLTSIICIGENKHFPSLNFELNMKVISYTNNGFNPGHAQ